MSSGPAALTAALLSWRGCSAKNCHDSPLPATVVTVGGGRAVLSQPARTQEEVSYTTDGAPNAVPERVWTTRRCELAFTARVTHHGGAGLISVHIADESQRTLFADVRSRLDSCAARRHDRGRWCGTQQFVAKFAQRAHEALQLVEARRLRLLEHRLHGARGAVRCLLVVACREPKVIAAIEHVQRHARASEREPACKIVRQHRRRPWAPAIVSVVQIAGWSGYCPHSSKKHFGSQLPTQ